MSNTAINTPLEQKSTLIIENNRDNKNIVVDATRAREEKIENLKQEFYSSPMKMEQLRRSARIDGSTLPY